MQISEIEKMPIPTKCGRSLYPWEKMEVGDSFEVVDEKRQAYALQKTLVSASRQFVNSRRNERKYVTRKTGEHSVRVWRVQ